jgi:hypothetical protein
MLRSCCAWILKVEKNRLDYELIIYLGKMRVAFFLIQIKPKKDGRTLVPNDKIQINYGELTNYKFFEIKKK